MNTPQSDNERLIQICTDIYYDCKTIKELNRLTDEALKILAHQTAQDLHSYADAVDGVIGENESTDWEDSTDRQVAEECNQLRAGQRTALAKLREEWGIGG